MVSIKEFLSNSTTESVVDYATKKRASINNTSSAHLGLHSLEESDESIIYLIYSKDGVETNRTVHCGGGGGDKKKLKEKIIQFKLLIIYIHKYLLSNKWCMHDSLE